MPHSSVELQMFSLACPVLWQDGEFELGYDNPKQAPIPMIQLIGDKKIFQFHFSCTSKRGMLVFIVGVVWVDEIVAEIKVDSAVIQITSGGNGERINEAKTSSFGTLLPLG